jgi:hypothetical protein
MVEVKTLLSITHRCTVELCAAPRALAVNSMVTMRWPRSGHTRAPWAGRRLSEFASLLGLGPVGHGGCGLQGSLRE